MGTNWAWETAQDGSGERKMKIGIGRRSKRKQRGWQVMPGRLLGEWTGDIEHDII